MQQNQQAKTPEELEEEAFQREMEDDEVDAQAPAEAQTTTQDDPVNDPGVDQGEQRAERVEIFQGYTAEELSAALAEIPKLRKGLDTIGGTHGERLAAQQRVIDELRNQRAKSAEQDQQQITKLTPEKLSRLGKEYPELAQMLAEDLSGLIGQPQTPDLSDVEQKFQQKLDEDRQARIEEQKRREIKLLSREHPDWNEVAGYEIAENGLIRWSNPAFGNWVSAQPKEIQDQIINGEDAFDLADRITEYKKTLKTEKRQTHLERAIQPRGTPATRASSYADEEERLFQEELKREEY